MKHSSITSIATCDVPDLDHAVLEYEREQGRLTYNSSSGVDPLKDRPDLISKRNNLFAVNAASYSDIFTNIISADGEKFKDAIIQYKELTVRLTQFL